jgi:ABC-type phosphate transport system substrate-binding protein
MKTKLTYQALLAAGLMALAQAASAQVAVIVNPKNPLASMTPEQVAAIFLGKTATLPSGSTAVPADLPESSTAREMFYSKAANKSSAQVKATWARLTFSGKATPPKEVPTAADVKKHVANNPDAIGYIEKSAVDGTVKVVLIVE